MADSSAAAPSASQFIRQDWGAYSEEQHAVWALLYQRRMAALELTGSRLFLEGAQQIGLQPDRVPDLTGINQRLSGRTGWTAVPVAGFLPAREFFECLGARRFPTTVTVRPRAQIDYLPEPDIFHDVFGHVPLHAHPVFAAFLQHFGASACLAAGKAQVEAMARLFWFTVEFGLVRERGEIKLYGSGLISSQGDGTNALGPRCDRRAFSLDAVLAQPFAIDRLQDTLFVIESFDQLFDAVEAAQRRLGLAVH